TVAIPSGAGTPSAITVTATEPGSISRTWTVDGSPPAGFMRFSRSGGGINDIDPGGTVVIQFTATATTTGSKEWTTTAFMNNNYTQPFNIQGPQPTVTICTAVTIACPGNITVKAAQGVCSSNVAFAATATGTPTPTITYSKNPGTAFPVGTTTVIATATNACA